jgi:hypothetical protein
VKTPGIRFPLEAEGYFEKSAPGKNERDVAEIPGLKAETGFLSYKLITIA